MALPPYPVAPFATTVPSAPRQWASAFARIHVDLGSGDGAYAIRLARQDPALGVIALDINQDHVRGARRRHPANVRFVQADACAYPEGFLPRAGAVTINFPYGSLLRALVEADQALLARLDRLVGPGGRLAVRVNATALAAAGFDPAPAMARIATNMRAIPGMRVATRQLAQADLRAFPTSWAKRLGYGRETVAILIDAARAVAQG